MTRLRRAVHAFITEWRRPVATFTMYPMPPGWVGGKPVAMLTIPGGSGGGGGAGGVIRTIGR